MRAGGVAPPRRPLADAGWAWVGSFLGLLAIYIIGRHLQLSTTDNLVFLSSLGASASLIYGVPRAEFSQPRNVIGGHVVSAVVGIAIYQTMPDETVLASALSVSLAIVAMLLTRTLHPPGAATALTTIVGSETIHELGFWFVISPVLTGTVMMVLIGVIINNFSPHPSRHYPSYWW